MVLQQKKSGKLMWTQSWRRLNKKGKDEGVAKKKTRKTVRVQRAIGSFTKEEIKAKKDAVVQKPKDAATEAALKEIKERQKVLPELMCITPPLFPSRPSFLFAGPTLHSPPLVNSLFISPLQPHQASKKAASAAGAANKAMANIPKVRPISSSFPPFLPFFPLPLSAAAPFPRILPLKYDPNL